VNLVFLINDILKLQTNQPNGSLWLISGHKLIDIGLDIKNVTGNNEGKQKGRISKTGQVASEHVEIWCLVCFPV
jgi:hypothetical protein